MAQPVFLCSAAIGFVLPAHAPRGLIMTRPTAPLRVPKLAAYDPALEQAVDAAVEAALEKAAAVAASSSASFWQLAFVFVCGGLFFSAVAAAVGAVYAVGLDNARRGFRLFGLLWRRVGAVSLARRTCWPGRAAAACSRGTRPRAARAHAARVRRAARTARP